MSFQRLQSFFGIRRAAPISLELLRLLQMTFLHLESFLRHPRSCADFPGTTATSPDVVPASPKFSSVSVELRGLLWSCHDFDRCRSCAPEFSSASAELRQLLWSYRDFSRVFSSISRSTPISRESRRLLRSFLRHPRSYDYPWCHATCTISDLLTPGWLAFSRSG